MQSQLTFVASPEMEILIQARNRTEIKPTRVGAVSYLNTKPLIYGLQKRLADSGKVSLELPSRLASQLSEEKIDVGLIPVFEYFKNSRYRIVSNAAIACRGPVWSVRLFFKCDPSRVRTIAMDVGSRTSAALTKVLFHARFGFVPESVPLELATNPVEAAVDAVLVIGDRAMHPEDLKKDFRGDWDLGQAWFEETGLPFVFAMWVARNEQFAEPKLIKVLEESRQDGLRNLDEITWDASKKYGLSQEQCADYLTNYIRFQLGPEELDGMAEFRLRCQRLNLI